MNASIEIGIEQGYLERVIDLFDFPRNAWVRLRLNQVDQDPLFFQIKHLH